MISHVLTRRIALAAIGAALLSPVAALAADSFFAGKTVTIIAGFRPGGGVDGTARLIARHYGKFIPGNPSMQVKNIAGAAGGVAANHMYNKADKDGLTLSVPGRTWMMSKLYGEPGVRYDPVKFEYIGSPGPVNNMMWVRADLGLKSFADLKKAKKKVVMGALNLRSTNGLIPKILEKDGLPVSVLPGYKATSAIMLAIEQKEVDGMYSSDETFRSNRADLIDNKVVIPLLQATDEIKDLPLFENVISEKSKGLYNLATAAERFGVPLIAPSGVPADRVAVLRKAFVEMARDTAYIEDAKKVGAPIGHAIEGARLAKMIADTLNNATPEEVKLFHEYTGKGQDGGKKGKKG